MSMQVLETTDKITPKSVLRHRPIGDSKPPRKRSIITNASGPSIPVTPIARRASRPGRPGSFSSAPAMMQQKEDIAEDSIDDEQDEVIFDTDDEKKTKMLPVTPVVPITPRLSSQKQQGQRTSSSLAAKPHASTTTKSQMKPLTRPKATQQAHPLLYLGVGMLSMIVLWTILSGVIHWANVTLDDLRYGRPRTAQYDVAVGHNDSATDPSHFIVVNLNRRIEVIELPGGDASHAHIYMGPQLYGADDDLTPATLSFVDVNGDHKLDMIINVQGSHIVFINDQGVFRQPTASERHQVDQFLQHWQP